METTALEWVKAIGDIFISYPMMILLTLIFFHKVIKKYIIENIKIIRFGKLTLTLVSKEELHNELQNIVANSTEIDRLAKGPSTDTQSEAFKAALDKNKSL